jgi:hypothetical protein
MNVPCITEPSIKITTDRTIYHPGTGGYQPLCAAYFSDLAAIATSISVQCRILKLTVRRNAA